MLLHQFIVTHMEAILQEWENFARSIWPGDLPDTKELRDHAEEMLRAVAADIQTPQTQVERHEKSMGRGLRSDSSDLVDNSSARHARSRAQFGFDLRALVAEYRALRASVLRLWSRQVRIDPDGNAGARIEEITRFNEAIDQLLAESVMSHAEHVAHSREIFLGILGHDLRTPLSAINMLAHLLEEKSGLSGAAAAMASKITGSAREMQQMIIDLLDFTRSRLGARMVVSPQPTDVGQLCREVIEELGVSHPGRVIEFEAKADGWGNWDRARLRQLISNLLGNALQHGAPELPVGITVDGGGNDTMITVRNGGTPIPKEMQKEIFEPLRRNHSEDELSEPGSIGLGLYIAREVVLAHNGTIHLESDDRETAFVVKLPRGG